jgi:UDP-2-acetamido-2-deoxy-ribo-hexuluronate aminotransferase
MKFVDLEQQYRVLENDIQSQIQRVLAHGQFIMGEEVFELERQLASYSQTRHCVTLNSGTDALYIALRALDIGPGDEVITSVFSFFSTVESILLVGATPIFVDINPETFNIDSSQIEQAITERTRAIMPVDLYGQCVDYETIWQLAKSHELAVIGDAAQSFGATYKNQQVGSLATITCTSFFPAKPLGAYGDGGACFTEDNELAEIMRQLRDHGQFNRYEHVRLGINSRLDTMQAAILLTKLKVFSQEIKDRQKVAAYYNKHLSDIVKTPTIQEGCTSSYAQYTIRVNNRDAVQEHLRSAKVPTSIHYPLPLNEQPYFKNDEISHKQFEHAKKASSHVLSLPMHPYLTQKEQDIVIDRLHDALEP